MYKTILIPLDHSDADETIIAHVQPLAKIMNSRLVLVHVADGHVARNQEQLNLADSEEIRADREYLRRRVEQLSVAGFQVSCHLAAGEPAAEILNLVAREQADLIAMATHGHGFIKDTILGSVATQLRHRTNLPILMLRAESA